MNEFGATLLLRNSLVDGNVARVTPPVGRFAAGGGVFTRAGSTLTIDASVVRGNTVEYSTSVPSDDPCSGFAQAGGIKIGGDESTTVTVRGSTISDNRVLAQATAGEVVAFAGGIDADGSLVMRNSAVNGNRVTGTSPDGAFVDGGGLELEGPVTIRNVEVRGNTLAATTFAGQASSEGAGLSAGTESATIEGSLIADNSATSTASGGTAIVEGAGLVNAGSLALRHAAVSGNTGTAIGSSGGAKGGGIWNGDLGYPPPVALLLDHVTVSGNALTGSAGLPLHGGGIFTEFPITLDHSLVAGNTPDECYGC
jgi:hypothetical protein